MKKAEKFVQGWQLSCQGDFSQVDETYHPDYSATNPDTGITVNLEDDKLVMSTYSEDLYSGSISNHL
jgi:hypothetical protein